MRFDRRQLVVIDCGFDVLQPVFEFVGPVQRCIDRTEHEARANVRQSIAD